MSSWNLEIQCLLTLMTMLQLLDMITAPKSSWGVASVGVDIVSTGETELSIVGSGESVSTELLAKVGDADCVIVKKQSLLCYLLF